MTIDIFSKWQGMNIFIFLFVFFFDKKKREIDIEFPGREKKMKRSFLKDFTLVLVFRSPYIVLV